MVRQDTWNEVPNDLKPIIEAASRMSMIDHSWIHMEDAAAMLKFEQAGVEIAHLPEDVQAAIYELVQVVHEENCAADPFYKEVYDAQQEFLNTYRIVEYMVQPEYRWLYE
jgi:TRAP-type mannitol/chloroaromatic compound transport system substrate-binding protein